MRSLVTFLIKMVAITSAILTFVLFDSFLAGTLSTLAFVLLIPAMSIFTYQLFSLSLRPQKSKRPAQTRGQRKKQHTSVCSSQSYAA